jgi:hypothetical protein
MITIMRFFGTIAFGKEEFIRRRNFISRLNFRLNNFLIHCCIYFIVIIVIFFHISIAIFIILLLICTHHGQQLLIDSLADDIHLIFRNFGYFLAKDAFDK